ncbi:hypothetical protein LCM20_09890 [Halobacillus litoralis]|uniref:hypothetical protein n=1 Tax=Halobacillus litoralis TaxID=45668 RepID=UPI001CD33D97|nr:hypothetical protein [Halobacillus litoralis]MCA0970901.1 hypothetical protein [Halobacillus litoralis]
MEKQELSRLRKKRILLYNLYAFMIMVVGLILLTQASEKLVFLTFSIWFTVAGVLELVKYKTGRYAWTEDMNALVLYEKEAMDRGAFKAERFTQYFSQLVVAFLGWTQYFMADNRPFVIEPLYMWIIISFAVIVIATLNIGRILRDQKIDQGKGTFQEIRRINWIMSLSSLAAGIFVLLVISFAFNLNWNIGDGSSVSQPER